MKSSVDNRQVRLFHAEIRYTGCDPRLLDDVVWVGRLLRKCAAAAHMQIVDSAPRVHRFKPEGVTAYVLLAESHISIHTWPQHGWALLDILTCNSRHVRAALELLDEEMKPKKRKIRIVSNNSEWK